jgi:hypothetical protein
MIARARDGRPAKAYSQTRFFELESAELKCVYSAVIGKSWGTIANDDHAHDAADDKI